MKADTLQVGVEGFSVVVNINVPETKEDVSIASKGNQAYEIAKFNRGYRIDLQEGGARQVVREMIAGKSPSMLKDLSFIATVKKAVEVEIAGFDPAQPRARATKPVAQTVTVEKDRQYSAEEVAALLANIKGLTVVASGNE